MLKSSLLEILRTFGKDEFMKFEDFLHSPYHNKNSNTLKLYSVIKEYSPGFSDVGLDKEVLWKKLFPERDYNYGTMKNLIHELSKLAMKFIVLEEFEENILEKDVILMNCLNERNIHKLFNVKMNEIERYYSKKSFKKEYFFVNDFYDAYSKIKWIKIYHNRGNNLNAVTEKDLIEGSATFIYTFLIYLFKFYNNVLTDSVNQNFSLEKNILPVFLKEISNGTIDKLLEIVKTCSERDYIILSVFWKMSKSQLDNSSIDNFLDFKKSLTENIGIFSEWDAKDLFHLMSTSLNNLDASKINIDKELFEISALTLKNNIIFNRDGSIATSDFLLYLWRAFNANEYDALEKFSLKYIKKIPADSVEYSRNFSNALLLFSKEKFGEVLEIITSMNHSNFIIKVRMKHLKAKCLYELNDYLAFDSEYKSIYHFLKNNKFLSSKVKADTKYLFDNIKSLFRLREKLNSYDYDKLKKEIAAGSMNENSWLRVKVIEINSNK